jgi:hypothetical protein
LGDEERIAIHFQIIRNLGSVALKIGDGLDVDDGWHSDPCAVMGLNVGLNLVDVKEFAERPLIFIVSKKCWTWAEMMMIPLLFWFCIWQPCCSP